MAILRGVAFFAAILCAVFVRSDERQPIEIPLKDIWAYSMPGTKHTAELEADLAGNVPKGDEDQKLTLEIRRSLDKHADKPREAFAVLGTGSDALEEAHAVLTGKKKQQDSFPPNKEISIVFFSYRMGVYVHLDRVERRENKIEIHYSFVPHHSAEVTEHFALIPLRKLPSGEYSVDIIQSPIDAVLLQKKLLAVDEKSAQKYVCKPFVFSIR
jgi:hypothetical protein